METFDHSMKYAEYSDKSFMIYGDTKQHKDALKELGGKFNMNLNNPDGSGKTPGWIFPKSKETVVKNFLNTGTISGNFPKAEAKIPNKPVTRAEFESLKRRVLAVEMNPAITRTKCECPVCKRKYSILTVSQPKGSINISKDKHKNLPGYEKFGAIIIQFDFPEGIDTYLKISISFFIYIL